MLKTFLVGIVLGLIAAAASLYAFPVVDQHREASIISVTANGGNDEFFHVNIPDDRIMLGAAVQQTPFPEGLEWPAGDILPGIRSELFKLRNARETVIGIASRTTVANEKANAIEWLIHLPARGSVLVRMNPDAEDGGFRRGVLRAGSREFELLTGSATERWVLDISGGENAPQGRIELRMTSVSTVEAVE